MKTKSKSKKADLPALAKLANAAHRKCERDARSMLDHSHECGQWLLQAKEQLPHGEFTAWVEENCTFTPRMARKYMTLANGWDELTKRNHGSVLSLDSLSMREALRLLAAGGPEETGVWQYVDADCPSCGARMVRTTHHWVTCPECWDCKLYGSIPGELPGSQRPVAKKQEDVFADAMRCARQLTPDERADLVTAILAMNKTARASVLELITH